MPVEFISATHISDDHRKVHAGFGGFDPDYTRRFVHALDDGGFDWTLVAYGSPSPDSLQLGQFVANNSERVKPMIAHRPGFQFPTQVATAFAGLDRISGGRVGIHIITGGSDVEQRREGDYLSKEERYERSDEFIQILRKVWYEDGPISFEGKHYRFEDFETEIKPVQDQIQVSVGGSSPEAYDVGGRLGDIFGLWGEPLAETKEQIAAVNAVADAAGRPRPRIWNSFRPIVAPTDELAWEKAHAILARTEQALAKAGSQALRRFAGNEPQNVGSIRLRKVADKGDLHDRALWTPLAKALKGGGSTTALVGSYETVAAALVDYTEIGCDLLSIRGWDVYNDMVDYGRHVLPLVREELAHREATGNAPVLNPDSREAVAV
jgi:alkanesulfonate monooxygenase